MKKVSITKVKRLYLCCIQINVVDSHFGEHFLCVVIHTNDKHRLYVSRRCFCFIIIQRKELLTMPVIDVKATGTNIKNIIKSKGFRISDVQARCGFNTPQAIFKWMRGDAVPTIDNLIILADMFDIPIDKIIIVTRI